MFKRGIGFTFFLLLNSFVFAKSTETVIRARGVHINGWYDITIGLANIDESISDDNLITFSGAWNLENSDGIYLRQSVSRDSIANIYETENQIVLEFKSDDENFCPVKTIKIDKNSKETTVIANQTIQEFFLDSTNFTSKRDFHRFQGTPYVEVKHNERLNTDTMIDLNLSIFGSELLKRFPRIAKDLPKKVQVPAYVESQFFENESADMPRLDFAGTKIIIRGLSSEGFDAYTIGEVILTDGDIQSISFEQNAEKKDPNIVLKFKKSGKKFIPIESIVIDIATWNSVKIELRPTKPIVNIKTRTFVKTSQRDCKFQMTLMSLYGDMGH